METNLPQWASPSPALKQGRDTTVTTSPPTQLCKSGATLLKHSDVLLLGEVGSVSVSTGSLGWHAGELSSPCLLLISTTALPWDH